jgi:hypothetical protein
MTDLTTSEEQGAALVAPLYAATSPAERRAAIMAFQAQLDEQPQVEPPLRHHFAPGVYGREIFMAAPLVIVGKIHQHAHLNTVSKGRCIVFTPEDGPELIEAGDTWVSKPATKRIVFILEDVLWTTTHANPTDARDLEWLESQLIAPAFDHLFYEAGALTPKLQ